MDGGVRGSEKNYKNFFHSSPECTVIKQAYQGVGDAIPAGFTTLPAQSEINH